jgi:hypothetical protein
MFNALEHFKRSQRRILPGVHHGPFNTERPRFTSDRSRQELHDTQAGQIIEIPVPKRSPSVMDLAEVIGDESVKQIRQSGQLVFHTVGDTGAGQHEDLGDVVQVMSMDFQRPNPADHPAFFMHLGDVCYNLRYGVPGSKRGMYEPQFYIPYSHYPGKIVAIPGNHDSNPEEDPHSIEAFEDNFCAPPPHTHAAADAMINAPNRPPMYQPGVYYRFDAPFARIIALFSNGGETEGVIQGPTAGEAQFQFLIDQLKQIKAARDGGDHRALLVAVHHPPYSGGGGHSGSRTMGEDLDKAFDEAHIMPDAILSGHSHLYQRFTRERVFEGRKMQVPYIVGGNGGHNITPLKPTTQRKHVRTPVTGHTAGGEASDHSLRQYFNGFGHLVVTATDRVLTVDLIGTHTESSQPVDSVTVDLRSSAIVNETPSFDHPIKGEKDFHG